MAAYSSLVLFLAASCLSAPADEPVRVDLPVYDQPEAASGGAYLARPLELENYGTVRNDKTPGGIISQKFDIPDLRPQEVLPGTVNEQNGQGWFAAPVTTLEGALLETEGLGSKAISSKDNLHNIVAGIFQPKPIVDTIKEEEKYGNSGDKFYSAGRALVGGAQGVSNFVNSVLEVPGTIIRKITRTASEKLNNLGGKLIGL